MSAWPFYLAYLMPASVFAGYLLGGAFAFLTLFLAFVIIPLLDLIVAPDRTDPAPEETEALAHRLGFRLVTNLYAAVQVAVVIWGAYVVTHSALSTIELMGLILSIAITTGGIGITVAHELCHKKNFVEKSLGKVLLMAVSYMHFYIEHNIGHHVNVCTPKDPATARLGESFYAFYPRTVIGSFRSAWNIEMERLRKAGCAKWGHHNQMLWFVALPILFAGVLGAIFGWKAIPYFFAQSILAFSLLEAVNYLEHYGLERKEIAAGHYEKVGLLHAWNADHRITNYFLFRLQRHVDHHIHPARRYQTLRRFDESPQLPTGYPGMVLLALIPPLWRKVMDLRVQAIRKKSAL
jgi:alkane 1-monooxygenase